MNVLSGSLQRFYVRIFFLVTGLCISSIPLSAQHIHYYICENDSFIYPLVSDGAFYTINYGDGISDSSAQPMKHRYAGNGIYSINIVKKSHKGSDNIVFTGHVGSLPPISFTTKAFCSKYEFSNGCPDTVLINGGWRWDFGDSANNPKNAGPYYTSNLKSPSHIYKKQGPYTVTMQYGSAAASKQKVSHKITVTLATFYGFDYQINENAALFRPRDTTALIYHWDFGDHDTAITESPFHTWQQKGSYPVTLVTEDKSGCISWFMDTVVAGRTGIKPLDGNANLFQAYPNPFSSTMVVHYELTGIRKVSLKLYDGLGKLSATVFEGQQHEGRYDIEFHPADHNVKCGVYTLIAVFGEVSLSQRLIMIQ